MEAAVRAKPLRPKGLEERVADREDRDGARVAGVRARCAFIPLGLPCSGRVGGVLLDARLFGELIERPLARAQLRDGYLQSLLRCPIMLPARILGGQHGLGAPRMGRDRGQVVRLLGGTLAREPDARPASLRRGDQLLLELLLLLKELRHLREAKHLEPCRPGRLELRQLLLDARADDLA